MNALLITASTFASIYALWVFYLAVMCLKSANDSNKLTKWGKAFAYPVLWVGLFLDFVINLFVLTVVLLELPQEYVVTARLSRHVKDTSGFRHAIAIWLCSNLLDPFDPSGCHCK